MTNNMKAYKFFRTALGVIYRFWYHPNVIGTENIPEKGSIIVVGNHVHIMDQCNIIISTKRNIHYMAKKEYFDGKMAWFFRMAGCIPVNRSIKDTSATKEALEVLKNNHALGLFPEGTRNALKEEKIKELYKKYNDSNIDYKTFKKKIKNNKTSFANYLEELIEEKIITEEEYKNNVFDMDSFLKELIKEKRIKEKDYFDHILLPLKFGAVSMAHKTDSLIVPYAITGQYKFRSKDLTIQIGKPFKVENDLEKANIKLDKEIKNLMKQNLKNSEK